MVNFKKYLLSIGFAAALSDCPYEAQADFPLNFCVKSAA